MSKNQVGIDLGSTAVRAVAVSGTDKAGMPQVTAVSIVPLPPGALVAGRVEHADIVAAAIKRALKSGGMRGYGAMVGVSTPKVGITAVQLPAALKPQEWANVMRLEGRVVSPVVRVSEGYLGFSRIPVATPTGDSNPSASTPDTLLSVSVVRQEDVDALLDVCRQAKVIPRAVDLAAAATFRGLTAMPAGDHSSVSTIVDIGATTVTVATRVGRRLRSVRVIDEGSDNITLAIRGALNISPEEAEGRKKSVQVGQDESSPAARSVASLALAVAYGEPDEDSVKSVEDPNILAARAATSATDSLIEKIASSIDSDLVNNANQPTTSITLCGRGALLHGLTQRVEARLGIPTSVRRPYMNIVESSKTASVFTGGVLDPARTLELVTATGLALWNGER